MSFNDIINELKAGNQRFVARECNNRDILPSSLATGQAPSTIILTCADSRVPPELLFDQDLGELFVIRLAGNTATAEAIGSIEYAAANLGSSVCVVLGHSSCGAVAAAVDHVMTGNALPSNSLAEVVAPIVSLVDKNSKLERVKLIDQVIDKNVVNVAKNLTKHSEILRSLVNDNKLKIVNAKYHLDSGKVEFDI